LIERRKGLMKAVKKDLQTLTKEFKALTKKMGQLTTTLKKTAVVKLEHAQAAIKLETPAQHAAGALKALRRQTDKLIKAVDKFEKEKAAKRKKAKKPARKAPAKKARKVTDTDKVLNIIKRSKKGVDVATLAKKTGFEKKKVSDIIFRASKQGKIKRTGKGIYIGA
jgi:predicted Rossmann fold nucleotide-binding protein DprA/Smf involved in DNA uptake